MGTHLKEEDNEGGTINSFLFNDAYWSNLKCIRERKEKEMHISAMQSNHLIYLQFTTEFQYLNLIFELNVPYWEPATIAIHYANNKISKR